MLKERCQRIKSLARFRSLRAMRVPLHERVKLNEKRDGEAQSRK